MNAPHEPVGFVDTIDALDCHADAHVRSRRVVMRFRRDDGRTVAVTLPAAIVLAAALRLYEAGRCAIGEVP